MYQKCDARAKLLFWLLRRHPLGHSVILIFSGQKSCTRIIWSILHSFLHFSRAKDVINHLYWTPKKFLLGARKNECQILQNYSLHMKFLEFYLYNHKSCEIWRLFSRTSRMNFLWFVLEMRDYYRTKKAFQNKLRSSADQSTFWI